MFSYEIMPMYGATYWAMTLTLVGILTGGITLLLAFYDWKASILAGIATIAAFVGMTISARGIGKEPAPPEAYSRLENILKRQPDLAPAAKSVLKDGVLTMGEIFDLDYVSKKLKAEAKEKADNQAKARLMNNLDISDPGTKNTPAK